MLFAQAEYLGEDGVWYHWFTGSDGEVYNLTHVFYATEQDHLNIATIQEVMNQQSKPRRRTYVHYDSHVA